MKRYVTQKKKYIMTVTQKESAKTPYLWKLKVTKG